MSPFPHLETECLLLRQLTEADLGRIVALAGAEAVAATTLNIPHPYAKADARHWLGLARQGFARQDAYIFGIERQESGEFIGGIGLSLTAPHRRAEAGYWLGQPYWNRGYGTEALGALLRFGFETLALHKITSSHYAINPASGKVMTKNGLVKEGELAAHILKNGQWHDLWVYGLLRAAYAPPR
ncbi:GNAT family N-acetyltransferase [Hymenobacter sp.]|uniref:GNAT family N-acetyltransferase n=1 Tax=Hymenobacter sp. TaxID=1898978 RepID=UPI00286C0347|nr:GNAT family N-acetyltransferase [Hymenobacter sp.]